MATARVHARACQPLWFASAKPSSDFAPQLTTSRVTDEAGGLVVPLAVDVVQRIDERRSWETGRPPRGSYRGQASTAVQISR